MYVSTAPYIYTCTHHTYSFSLMYIFTYALFQVATCFIIQVSCRAFWCHVTAQMPKQGNGAVGIGPGGGAVCVGCLSGWFLLWPKDVNMCETRTHGGRPLRCQVFSVPGKLSNHVDSCFQHFPKALQGMRSFESQDFA